jgi:ABC-type sugar transport system ATPase subunit
VIAAKAQDVLKQLGPGRLERAVSQRAVRRPAAARGGGARHRARARVLLFDEPLSNLDAKLRRACARRSATCSRRWG